MLEKIIRKITPLLLAAELFSYGCGNGYYKTAPIEEITSQKSTTKENTVLNIDYKNADWEDVIKEIKTPYQAQKYLTEHLKYDLREDGNVESFKENFYDQKGVCIDYAISAAALLKDDGYKPLVLIMESENITHAVYVYKQNDKYYALGNTPIKEGFKDIERLVKFLGFKMDEKYEDYFVVDLDKTYGKDNWIKADKLPHIKYISSSDKNVKKIE